MFRKLLFLSLAFFVLGTEFSFAEDAVPSNVTETPVVAPQNESTLKSSRDIARHKKRKKKRKHRRRHHR